MKARFGWFYTALGALGALCIFGVLFVQIYNIVGRFAGFQLDGGDSYAGYLLAGGAFFTLAAALRKGDHIRVTLILNRLSPSARVKAEMFCLAVAIFLSGYFAFYAIKLVYQSYAFHDISQNIDATPLWIPQLSMALGLIGLTMAFLEEFWHVITTRELPAMDTDEIARTE